MGIAEKKGLEKWRKRVRVEHTLDGTSPPNTGFEDRGGHRTSFASMIRFYRVNGNTQHGGTVTRSFSSFGA